MPQRLAWIALAFSAVLLSCACSIGRPRPMYHRTLAWAGTRIEIEIPPGQTLSIGTYRVRVRGSRARPLQWESRRDGTITGLWLDDIQGDERPELVVATTSAGSGSYGDVHVYALEDTSYHHLHIAPLPTPLLRGYMGHDHYDVRAGRLFRGFPRYREGDPNANPTDAPAEFSYSFTENEWIADE